jgi:hypothetical protein
VQNVTRASNFTRRQIAYVVIPKAGSMPSRATPIIIRPQLQANGQVLATY